LFEETDMPSETEWRKYFRPRNTLFELFGLRPGMTLVDLGCGYGTFSIPAAQIVGMRGLVYAIDIDEKMVGRVLSRARRRKLTNVKAIVSDISTLTDRGVPYSCADIVLLVNIIHGTRNRVSLLKSVKRFLKRNGRVIVMNWAVDPKTPRGPPMKMRPSPEQTVAYMKSAGYDQSLVMQVPPYHYAVIADA
jgi:ubiquinone/menaquinone biosynthesis C-methylase UbiE